MEEPLKKKTVKENLSHRADRNSRREKIEAGASEKLEKPGKLLENKTYWRCFRRGPLSGGEKVLGTGKDE